MVHSDKLSTALSIAPMLIVDESCGVSQLSLGGYCSQFSLCALRSGPYLD
jgi:hypothetical protein